MLSEFPFDALALDLQLAVFAFLPLSDLLSIHFVNRELSQLVSPFVDAWRPYKLLAPCSADNDLRSQLTHFLETREEDLHFKNANIRTLDISLRDNDHARDCVTTSTLVDNTPLLVQCIEKFIPLQIQKLCLDIPLCEVPDSNDWSTHLEPLVAALSRLATLRFLSLSICLTDMDLDTVDYVGYEVKVVELFLNGLKHPLKGLEFKPTTSCIVTPDISPSRQSSVLCDIQDLDALKLNMTMQTMKYIWPTKLRRLCLFTKSQELSVPPVTDDEPFIMERSHIWLPCVGRVLSRCAETLVDLEILLSRIGTFNQEDDTLPQLIFPKLRSLTFDCTVEEDTMSVFRSQMTSLFSQAPIHILTLLASNEEQITIWLEHEPAMLGREVDGEREPESFNFLRDILQSRREGSGWGDLKQIVLSDLILDRLMAGEESGVVHELELEGISVVLVKSVWTRSWDF